MASLWLLIHLLKCIDFLSWPVLALGYPLCASVRAIENDNNSDTRNLISYWILLSLIYLFDYAFLKLLQWFQYWYYMKLMIVVCLVIPDFGRSSHVYNQLIRSCIYMNPRVAIRKFRNWKRVFVEKEDFLMLAEKYITENGTGALEKLIACKNTQQNLEVEAKKAAPTAEKNDTQQNTAQNLDTGTEKTVRTIEKSEAQQTNKVRLPLEQKDIKDLEMIEKEEIPNGKPIFTFMPQTNTACAAPDQIRSPYLTYQKLKEWWQNTQKVRTTSEADLNCHLHGRLHKAACEALKAKNQSVAVEVSVKKNETSGGEPEKMINTSNSSEQKITTCHHPKIEQKNVKTVNVRKYCYRPKRTIDQENTGKIVHVIPKVQELQNSETPVLKFK
ncbi:uncharacterized protein LOC114731850 [Neltuma alba]|uniref:uncharacterized protein LOC114731850 n=1 Tax=Neltuma alba TaxID=207710 RepID=UPI0010A43048|nr:uncharacterized protein LOC114731850 [Prosopis alba]